MGSSLVPGHGQIDYGGLYALLFDWGQPGLIRMESRLNLQVFLDDSQTELLPGDKQISFTANDRPQLYTAEFWFSDALAWATYL